MFMNTFMYTNDINNEKVSRKDSLVYCAKLYSF